MAWKTTMAGNGRFRAGRACFFLDRSFRSGFADIARKKAIRANPPIGSKGDFPGPLFSAVAPCRGRVAAAAGAGTARSATRSIYDGMLRVSGGGRFTQYHRRFLFRFRLADHLAETFGNQGFAGFHFRRPCAVRRQRHPARSLKPFAAAEADAALCVANRRVGSIRKPGPVLLAVGANRPHNDPPQAAVRAVSRRTATVS